MNHATGSATDKPPPPQTTAGQLLQGGATHRIILSFRKATQDFLNARRDQLFSQAKDRLFKEADQAASDIDQADFFDAMQELQKVAPSVWSTFQAPLLQGLDQLFSAETRLDTQADAAQVQELALVDTQSFNDMIIVQKIREQGLPLHEDQEADLNQRLSKLLHREINASSNVVGVNNFCSQFHEAVQNMGMSKFARKALFDSFEQSLIGELGRLLADANQILADHHVLPQIPARSYEVKRNSRARPNRPARALAPEGGVPDPQDTGEENAPSKASATPAPRPGQPAPAISPVAASAPQLPAANHAITAARAYTPGRDAFTTARSLFQLAGGRNAVAPQRETQTFARQELVTLLSRARSQTAAAVAADQRFDLLKALDGATQSQSDDAPARTIGRDENTAIVMVTGLIDALLDDLLVSNGVKAWLARMEPNLATLALQDDSFLTDEAHPGRSFINRLGQLELAGIPAGDSPAPFPSERLDAMVSRLADGPAHTSDFEDALGELDDLLARQARSYQRNLSEVIRDSKAQWRLFDAPRAARTAGGPSGREPDYPPELRKTANQLQRLRSGDKLRLRRNGRDRVDSLAWMNEQQTRFVFVDRLGRKSATLDRWELAEAINKGHAELLQEAGLPAMDRGILSVFRNIQIKLQDEAAQDPITGLPNQKHFHERLQELLTSTRLQHRQHVLCYIALDNFPRTRQQVGNKRANNLLGRYASVLRKHFGERGPIGSLDGHEFAVVLEDTDAETGYKLAEQHRHSIHESRVVWRGEALPITISTGMISLTADSGDAGAEIESARIAYRKALKGGGNRTSLHGSASARRVSANREDWATVIPRTLEEDGLQLYRQLIEPLNPSTHTGHYEILLRLKGPDHSTEAPFAFIQAAERIGLMPDVDRWVIRHTLQWMADNPGEMHQVDSYAINLSGDTLSQEDLKDYVLEQMRRVDVAPAKLLFEITETLAINRLSVAVDFIETLMQKGCRFCLDDFGTGSSSYSYLKQLPVDYVKIDGLFIKDILNNEHDEAVVRSVNDISHFLGKHTVAEYVENQAIAAKLKEIGIDYVQGYGIAKPRPLPASA